MNRELSLQASFAIDLAKEAGSIMTQSFGIDMKKEIKSDGTVVTDADIRINSLMVRAIQKNYPGHNILAEEYSPKAIASDYTWVCDPIDGTISFSHGIPTAVFSIALVRKGRPIIGVVHDPFQERTFLGIAGNGSVVNNKKLSVSKNAELEGATIGFVAWKDAQRKIVSDYDKLIDKRARVLMLGSITYMGALVAAGELEGCIHPARMPFDTAAVKVIIGEAGGKVTSLSGKPQRYDGPIEGAIMSNGLIHSKLIDIVRP